MNWSGSFNPIKSNYNYQSSRPLPSCPRPLFLLAWLLNCCVIIELEKKIESFLWQTANSEMAYRKTVWSHYCHIPFPPLNTACQTPESIFLPEKRKDFEWSLPSHLQMNEEGLDQTQSRLSWTLTWVHSPDRSHWSRDDWNSGQSVSQGVDCKRSVKKWKGPENQQKTAKILNYTFRRSCLFPSNINTWFQNHWGKFPSLCNGLEFFVHSKSRKR